mmetsp:Transcript_44100/g.116637  ORF Transcript_44100/g.116637 Transcript_44100/m.116637 type:complete len:242 (+) Transcript_44100:1648-2373(+)
MVGAGGVRSQLPVVGDTEIRVQKRLVGLEETLEGVFASSRFVWMHVPCSLAVRPLELVICCGPMDAQLCIQIADPLSLAVDTWYCRRHVVVAARLFVDYQLIFLHRLVQQALNQSSAACSQDLAAQRAPELPVTDDGFSGRATAATAAAAGLSNVCRGRLLAARQAKCVWPASSMPPDVQATAKVPANCAGLLQCIFEDALGVVPPGRGRRCHRCARRRPAGQPAGRFGEPPAASRTDRLA